MKGAAGGGKPGQVVGIAGNFTKWYLDILFPGAKHCNVSRFSDRL